MAQNEIALRIAALDAERQQIRAEADERVAAIDAQIAVLEQAARIVNGEPVETKQPRHRRNPAAFVGEGAQQKVLAALATAGPEGLTRAEIARRSGVNDGTVTYSIRALRERGVVTPVGPERARGTRFVAATQERSTRVRPGR